jgi:hypothetical protein
MIFHALLYSSGYWREREDARTASPEEVAFFESPTGLERMQRIVLAAQLVLGFEPQRGIRGVCAFLERSVTRKGKVPTEEAASMVLDWMALFSVAAAGGRALVEAMRLKAEHGFAF